MSVWYVHYSCKPSLHNNTLFLISVLWYLGSVIHAPHGGYTWSICVSLPPQGIWAVADGKWGMCSFLQINFLYFLQMDLVSNLVQNMGWNLLAVRFALISPFSTFQFIKKMIFLPKTMLIQINCLMQPVEMVRFIVLLNQLLCKFSILVQDIVEEVFPVIASRFFHMIPAGAILLGPGTNTEVWIGNRMKFYFSYACSLEKNRLDVFSCTVLNMLLGFMHNEYISNYLKIVGRYSGSCKSSRNHFIHFFMW